MPIINPDTRDMVEIKPLDPGQYRARVLSCTPGTSKAGNPKIDVKFELSGPDGAVIPRTASLATSGKGTQGFDHFLRACGFDDLADQYRAGQAAPFDTDSVTGVEVIVHVVPNMYEGKLRDQIDDYSKV